MNDEQTEKSFLIEQIRLNLTTIIQSDILSEDEKISLVRKALSIVQGRDIRSNLQ